MKKFFSFAALAILLYATYFAVLLAAPTYLFSSFTQPLLFVENVISGKFPLPPARALILGDSTAGLAYRADKLPRTLSLAMFSASPVESYYTFVRYLEKVAPPRCLFISSSYALEYKRDYGFWDTYVFHGFYSWAELVEIQAVEGPPGFWPRALFLMKAFLYRAKLAGIHPEMRHGTLLETFAVNHVQNDWAYSHLRSGLGTLQIDKWDYAHDHASLAHFHEPFVPSALFDAYVDRLLSLAESKQVRVYWIQPPMLESFLDGPTRQLVSRLDEHLRALFRRHPNTTLDGSLKPYPASLMANPVHPNSAGSEKFSQGLKPLFEACQ
jgi:hypothetical protein